MQPIHNPAQILREKIERDIAEFLMRKGTIKKEPIRKAAPPKQKKLSTISPKQDFAKAQEDKRSRNEKVLEVKWCDRELKYHIYDGTTRISKDGFINASVAMTEASRQQDILNARAAK